MISRLSNGGAPTGPATATLAGGTVLVLFAGVSACAVDLGIEGHTFACKSDSECAPGERCCAAAGGGDATVCVVQTASGQCPVPVLASEAEADGAASVDVVEGDAPATDDGPAEPCPPGFERDRTGGHCASTSVGPDTGLPVEVFVPGGVVWMGCSDLDDDPCTSPRNIVTDESPDEVSVAPFAIDVVEVTVGAWNAVNRDAPEQGDALMPKRMVTWTDAAAACSQLRAGGRLCTEAEWELAARGPQSRSIFPWGSELPVTPDHTGDRRRARAAAARRRHPRPVPPDRPAQATVKALAPWAAEPAEAPGRRESCVAPLWSGAHRSRSR